MLNVYDYDAVTGEYIREDVAYDNPMGEKGDVLMPAHATEKEPLAHREGYVSVWNGTHWTYEEDHRESTGGQPYWLPGDTNPDDTGTFMQGLGPYPTGALFSAPVATQEQLIKRLNAVRTYKFTETTWLLERDADELSRKVSPTLSVKKMKNVLIYRQALRDITSLDGFPWDGGGPLTPWPSKEF